jgi:hypothetical protein
MFVPKWLLTILFLIAIGSTGGMLLLLAQRATTSSPTPSASSTVLVRESSSPVASVSANPTSVPAALSANAEWKKHTSTELSIKLEYPANWSLTSTDSAQLAIASDPNAAATPSDTAVLVTVTRDKKAKSTQKIKDYLADRSKEMSAYTVSDEKNMKIDTFDAVSRIYTRDSGTTREIVFFTKNYIYTVSIRPSSSSLNAVVEELLKTIEVI